MGEMPENFQFCDNFCMCPVGSSHLHHLDFINSEREVSKHRLQNTFCCVSSGFLAVINVFFPIFCEVFRGV